MKKTKEPDDVLQLYYTKDFFYALVLFLKNVSVTQKDVNKNDIPIRNKGLV